MIEFYKYLYAGGFALRTTYDYQKISQKWESQPNVSSCPSYFTPVTGIHLPVNHLLQKLTGGLGGANYPSGWLDSPRAAKARPIRRDLR